MNAIPKRKAVPPRKRVAALALAMGLATLIGGCAGTGYVSPADRLDASDLALVATTTEQALEKNQTGQSSNWSNTANGHNGTVTPTRTYKDSSGTPCRDYQQSATVENSTVVAYDTACRTGGVWRSVNYPSLSQPIKEGGYEGRRYASRYYGYPYYPSYGWDNCYPFYSAFCSPFPHSSVFFGFGAGH